MEAGHLFITTITLLIEFVICLEVVGLSQDIEEL
jgi:hypothetical protein